MTKLVSIFKSASAASSISLATSVTTAGPTSTLLMHFDGANGSTTFTDAKGVSTFTIASGSPVISTAQQKFGTASFYPGASGTSFIQTATNDALWTFAADYTIDFWIYPTSFAVQLNLVGNSVWAFYVSSAGNATFNDGATSYLCGAVSLNTWSHIAVARAGSTGKAFANGTVGQTRTSTGTIGASGHLLVGSNGVYGASASNLCYMDELRIINGTAVWTAGFTPPTSAYTN
jgi:hypothetical protein